MHRTAERAHAGGPKVPDVCGAGTAHWSVLGKRFPSRGCVSLVPRGDIGFIVQTSSELSRNPQRGATTRSAFAPREDRCARLTRAIDDAENSCGQHRDQPRERPQRGHAVNEVQAERSKLASSRSREYRSRKLAHFR